MRWLFRSSRGRDPERTASTPLGDGGRLVYAARTDRAPAGQSPVVLVHGLASHRYMRPLMNALADDYPVYAPDMPGFGLSDGKDIPPHPRDLADALADWHAILELPPAVWVGNSTGCQVIVELAVRHPARVKAVVLQGPAPDPSRPGLARQILDWMRNGRREPSMGMILPRDYANAGPLRMMRAFANARHYPMALRLSDVAAPALVIYGDRDAIISPAWARRVAEALPQGRLQNLPGSAHTINFMQPRRMADAIRQFVDGGTARP